MKITAFLAAALLAVGSAHAQVQPGGGGSPTGAPTHVQVYPFTGTPTQSAVSCTNVDTSLLAASAASKFILIQVPATAANGVWFNFAGAAATAATPNVYLAPGASINWSAVNGFVPTSAIRCISNTASTISVSVTYN